MSCFSRLRQIQKDGGRHLNFVLLLLFLYNLFVKYLGVQSGLLYTFHMLTTAQWLTIIGVAMVGLVFILGKFLQDFARKKDTPQI